MSRPAYARLGFLLTLLLMVSSAAVRAERAEIYPVEQITRGVKGYGLTVVQGTTIESFDVEVLGVLDGAGPSGDLYLIRVSGDPIERSGGIAAGMSGSPVYIGEKLLGAIGYGFQMTDHRLGLVTPAHDMMSLLDLLETEQESFSFEADTVMEPGLPLAVALGDGAGSLASDEVWAATPLRAPLLVGGLGERSMRYLRDVLRGYDVTTLPGARAFPAGGDDAALQPGSALGVQLVRGDVNLTAIGTVTAVDGERFVAFGHPFLQTGPANYIATSAYILHTVPSLSIPFKLGAPTGVIGAVTQDRGAGIAGRVGTPHQKIDVQIDTYDVDRNTHVAFAVEIAYDDVLVVPLVIISALEALDRSLDRVGPGTSWVDLHIESDGTEMEIRRSNMFYSGTDVAAYTVSELASAVRLLETNPFADPQVRSIQLLTRVDRGRHTAQVEQAIPNSPEIVAGRDVDVRVRLRPYRGEVQEVIVPFSVPLETPPGLLSVSVRSGEYAAYGMAPGEFPLEFASHGADEFEIEESTSAESFDQLIAEYLERPRNNELIFEYYPPSRSFRRSDREGHHHDAAGEDEAELGTDVDLDVYDGDGWDGSEGIDRSFEPITPVRTTFATPFVLRGETTFTVTVRSSSEDEAHEEGDGSDETVEHDQHGDHSPGAPFDPSQRPEHF